MNRYAITDNSGSLLRTTVAPSAKDALCNDITGTRNAWTLTPEGVVMTVLGPGAAEMTVPREYIPADVVTALDLDF